MMSGRRDSAADHRLGIGGIVGLEIARQRHRIAPLAPDDELRSGSCQPSRLLLQSCQLPQRLVARELSVDRIGKVGLDQPHLELGRLRQPIVDLAHAHRAENQGGCENRRRRRECIARDPRLVECIVESPIDHHQQRRDAPGTGELGDLDDQRMPGLA